MQVWHAKHVTDSVHGDRKFGVPLSPPIDLRLQLRQFGLWRAGLPDEGYACPRLRPGGLPERRPVRDSPRERLLPQITAPPRLDHKPWRRRGNERQTHAVQLHDTRAAREEAHQVFDVAFAIQPHAATIVLHDEDLWVEPHVDAASMTLLVLVD